MAIGAVAWVTEKRRKVAWLSAPCIVMWGVTLFVAALVLYPLFMLIWGSLMGAPPGAPSTFTLNGWRDAYTDPATAAAFLNTLTLTAVRAVLSTALAVFFALVLTRTDVPHRRMVQLMLVAPFAVPPLLMTLSWSLLASPKAGMLNRLFMDLLHVDKGPFDVYSYQGIIWVSVVNFVAVKILLLLPAFKAMDAVLEESSRMSGATSRVTFIKVTLPLMLPAILGVFILGFVRYMESFEVELFLGAPANIYVFTTRIFTLLETYPPEYPTAMALSVTLLLLTIGLVAIQGRLLGRRQFVTISGKGHQARPLRLGKARWLVFAVCIGFFVVSFVLPFTALFLNSISSSAGVYGLDSATFANYRQAISGSGMGNVLKNTLLLGFGAGTFGMLLASVVAYVITRTSFVGKRALDFLSWVPWTVPGVVLSVALLWAYVGLPGPIQLYGTVWILIVAIVTATLPLATRLMVGTEIQISKDLEESSRVSGASWLHTFVHVLLPLVRRGFLIGWIVLFVDALRALSPVILLFSAASMPVSIVIFVYWTEGKTRLVSALAVLLLVVIMALLALQMKFGEEKGTLDVR